MMSELYRLLFYSNYGASTGGPEQTFFLLMLAFVIGQIIGMTYLLTHRMLSYSQAFTASLVVVPVLVALMMLLMTGSLFIAFGLLAVFAVVRFRNVLKDTRDTTYILWSIVEGMAVGTHQESMALIGALMVVAIMAYLRVTQFGSRHDYDAVLNLLCVPNIDLNDSRVRAILKRHSLRYRLAATRKVGSQGIDMSYRVLLRDPARKDELQEELEGTEGIQRVSLFMREDESEV